MENLNERIQFLLLFFPPFLVAIIFHELSHAFVAKLWGDLTAFDAGRVTINPVPHIDPVGTIILPMSMLFFGVPFMFGWAKPVPINPNRFRKYRPGLFWVATAGPLMNFSLALLSSLLLCAFIIIVPQSSFLFVPLSHMLVISIFLNFALGMFNLIPLPPLDGSKIVESFLSYEATQKYEKITQYSFWILMFLLISGAIRIIVYPIQFFTQLTLTFSAWVFQFSGHEIQTLQEVIYSAMMRG